MGDCQWNFVLDGFVDGIRLRCLDIVDELVEECLAGEADTSLLGKRVGSDLLAFCVHIPIFARSEDAADDIAR